eukprot:CAMPEP_0184478894 /NCGR_PEP_ID=MMETSP0113_2-20130426/785_1 /TAXON_ID=91329 /ORGANISM="Norrisiella sphaerica, Strain BC52" /LENGTH=1000 /DNA_ID=CAMNT_0026856825 /DNA_START=36 /DNA_END=3038 /DNA_ORIENTATION=+
MPEMESTRSPCGLLPVQPTKDKPMIALVSVQAKVEIVHFCTRTILKQKFTNHGDKPLEVKYIFPVEDDAAVCGFEAKVGKFTIKGKVQGREEAKNTYSSAIQQKQMAALLEKDDKKENVFVCKIGNLLPKETCEIKITYVSELDSEGPAVRFVLPTVVSNGYIPWTPPPKPSQRSKKEGTLSPAQLARMSEAEQLDYIMKQSMAQAKEDASRRKKKEITDSPQRFDDTDLPYELSLTADVQMPSVITKISSPSHPIKAAYDSKMRKIIKLEKKEKLTKEFVLLIEQEDPYVTRATVEDYDTREGSFVSPTVKEKKQKCENDGNEDPPESRIVQISFNREVLDPDTDMFCEIIFLVDVSGSMSGSRMEQTKATLQIFLASLPTNCLFNIVRFNRRHVSLFPTSQQYNDQTMAQAETFVNAMVARGGTNIMDPLQAVLLAKEVPGYPRQVFLLTDGEVGNTDAIVQMSAEHAQSTRIFTFGIGSGASVALCKGVARKSRGTCEMVRQTDQITEQVMRTICSALQPPLCNTKVDWGDIALSSARFQQVPSVTPPVYPGRQFVYAKNVNTGKWKGGVINLTSSSNEDEEKITVQVSSGKPRKGTLLHVLAARSRIRELENLRRRTKAETDEIRRLALKYNLASSETSFVAVMEKDIDSKRGERESTGKSEKHVVPIAHGQDAISASTSASLRKKMAKPARSGARFMDSRVRRAAGAAQFRSAPRNVELAQPRSQRLEDLCAKSESISSNFSYGASSKLSFGAQLQQTVTGFFGGGGGRGKGINKTSRSSSRNKAASPGAPPPVPTQAFSSSPSPSGGFMPRSEAEGKDSLAPAGFAVFNADFESEECDDDESNEMFMEENDRASKPKMKRKAESKRGFGTKKVSEVVGPINADSAFPALVKLQKSDGSWELSKGLLKIAGVVSVNLDEAKVKEIVAAAVKGAGFKIARDERLVIGTIFALALLVTKFAAKKTAFFLLATKAKKFVAGCIGAKPTDVAKISEKLL